MEITDSFKSFSKVFPTVSSICISSKSSRKVVSSPQGDPLTTVLQRLNVEMCAQLTPQEGLRWISAIPDKQSRFQAKTAKTSDVRPSVRILCTSCEIDCCFVSIHLEFKSKKKLDIEDSVKGTKATDMIIVLQLKEQPCDQNFFPLGVGEKEIKLMTYVRCAPEVSSEHISFFQKEKTIVKKRREKLFGECIQSRLNKLSDERWHNSVYFLRNVQLMRKVLENILERSSSDSLDYVTILVSHKKMIFFP